MKKTQKILLFLFSFGISHAFCSGTDEISYEENKTIHKAFKISSKLELNLESKYGDIFIDTWDKDSVSFDIAITVLSNDSESGKELLEGINVVFDKTGDFISAYTEWNQYSSKVKKTAIDVATIFGRERKIIINYTIKLPKNSELEIENSFGNITLNDFEGDIDLDVSHGDIRLRKVKDISNLKISYGKLRIKECHKADIESRSSDISIDRAGKMKIESSGSDIEIDKVDDLRITSKHDKIEIEEIKTINFIASWSDIKIESLEQNIFGEIKYGDLSVDKIASPFLGVELNGNNAEIELNFEEKIAFRYDVSLINGKRFSLPSKGNTTDKAETFGDIKEYEGIIATIPIGGKPASVIIKVKASYVDFRLLD